MNKESEKLPKWLDNLILTSKPAIIRKYWPYYVLAILITITPFILNSEFDINSCDQDKEFVIFFDCILKQQEGN